MESSGKRTRGPNKHAPWSRDLDKPVSVLRLALDTTDPMQRVRGEAMYAAAFSVRRALQHDARNRCKAYRAARHERARSPSAVRDRLGLSKKALEHAAYNHLDAAPHLRRFVTKALAMHLADGVWSSTERHLFRDASGRTQGPPGIGRWYDFTRLPGRARSHTTERKWETFRLHGSLEGHRAAYTDADGRFTQPRHMRCVEADSWWRHDGPLALVFTGLVGGDLVLPVRLPTAPSNQPCLDHHLADPTKWHKIDLVRSRDPYAAGGWRYEAHLMVLIGPYVSEATVTRRETAAIATAGWRAGIDINVSNITVASHVDGRSLRITRVERDAEHKARDRGRARRERRRLRDIERSRRAANRGQYQYSKRQQKRAQRRIEAGLPPQQVIPSGARKARSDGTPLQAYRHDRLSKTYQRHRATQIADAAAATRARRDRGRHVAGEIVATHGYAHVVEDCTIAAWSRSWGRAVAAFSPATLLAAIDREVAAVAGLIGQPSEVVRASTRTTALSQHCPCGHRVQKTLADRVHACPACGLRGDRDAVAAILASFVVHVDRDRPESAIVDFAASRAALHDIASVLSSTYRGWQDTPSESNARTARDGTFISWPAWTPDLVLRSDVQVARRNVGRASCSTPNETGLRQTTSERARMQANMFGRYDPRWWYLRDTS